MTNKGVETLIVAANFSLRVCELLNVKSQAKACGYKIGN